MIMEVWRENCSHTCDDLPLSHISIASNCFHTSHVYISDGYVQVKTYGVEQKLRHNGSGQTVIVHMHLLPYPFFYVNLKEHLAKVCSLALILLTYSLNIF